MLRLLLLCLALTNSAAHAQTEVHVLAVGRGHPVADPYARPEVRVIVDRPGAQVALVLLDGGDIQWRIEATDGTAIIDVMLGGRRPDRSAVDLSGTPMFGITAPELPLVFEPRGRLFRTVIDTVTDRMATDRVHSFRGVRQALGGRLRIDRVDTHTTALARDYLAAELARSDDLPTPLQNWQAADDTTTLSFDTTGVTLTDATGTRHFPVTGDVPRIVLPVAAIHATDAGRIYALSYGGEGFIYAIDITTGTWSVVTSLDGYDAAAMHYDAGTRALILTGAFSRPGDIRIYGLDGTRQAIFIPLTRFPGMSDLFAYGNEHGPSLAPLAYADGWLLLRARARVGSAFRLYAVQMDTMTVRLLDYGDD